MRTPWNTTANAAGWAAIIDTHCIVPVLSGMCGSSVSTQIRGMRPRRPRAVLRPPPRRRRPLRRRAAPVGGEVGTATGSADEAQAAELLRSQDSEPIVQPGPVGKPAPPEEASPHDTTVPSAGRHAANACSVERTSLLKPGPVGKPAPPEEGQPHDTTVPSAGRHAANARLVERTSLLKPAPVGKPAPPKDPRPRSFRALPRGLQQAQPRPRPMLRRPTPRSTPRAPRPPPRPHARSARCRDTAKQTTNPR